MRSLSFKKKQNFLMDNFYFLVLLAKKIGKGRLVNARTHSITQVMGLSRGSSATFHRGERETWG